MSGNIFGCHNCMWSVQAKDAAKHPTIPGSPTTKNYSVQNVNSADAETLTFKICLKIDISLSLLIYFFLLPF